MSDERPSRTAERVAEHRAAHQLLDVPLILDDPLALRIIRPEVAERLREGRNDDDSLVTGYRRAFFAVRSRFAEDELSEAVARGVGQYVLLGAGFDTFAYRHSYGAALRVFEVDRAATQREKRDRLHQAAIPIPSSVTFVPMDFATDRLDVVLRAAGLERSVPAFFGWLGVVPYLSLDAIDATLHFVGSGPPGTTLVFDYGVPRSSMNSIQQRFFDRMAGRVAAAGEPFQTFFEPVDLDARLRRFGFTTVADYAAAALNARYFAGRRDGLRVAGPAHLVKAVV